MVVPRWRFGTSTLFYIVVPAYCMTVALIPSHTVYQARHLKDRVFRQSLPLVPILRPARCQTLALGDLCVKFRGIRFR